jgi:ATP-dependent Lhr-like helicase
VPLQGLALPVAAWERDVLRARTGAYSPAWLDSLCASGELVWIGAGSLGRDSGRVALYFREDAALLGPPPGAGGELSEEPQHALLRARLAAGPCFFGDLLVELDSPAVALTQALWDLVWVGEVTNDAWAPLRAPRLTLVHDLDRHARPRAGGLRGGRRFAGAALRGGRFGASAQVQGRWSLTESIFRGEASPEAYSSRREGRVSRAVSRGDRQEGATLSREDRRARLRARAELLLERYGVLTREQVSAEGVSGGFSSLYGVLGELETLGVCRRGYFVEGLGGAQFALPGAVERLRSGRSDREGRAVVLAAVDPAQPYGAALPWPRREGQTRRPARVAGAYVVFVDAEPVLYLERGGRGIVTLRTQAVDGEDESSRIPRRGPRVDGEPSQVHGASTPANRRPTAEATPLVAALGALVEAVRAGRIDAVALERVDGEPALGSALEPLLIELGFRQGPRRLTLRA